ncbi:MAG: asparaginase [Actinomycetota bacterium]|nr:asparaginase [Actinomycetota bacterium]
MRRVVVLTTGGTIATRGAGLDRVARDSGEDLLGRVQLPAEVTVQIREVLRLGSYAFATADMRTVLTAVRAALTDPAVDGVVVTHGTDTMEETSFLVDLFLADGRPVVFTGAQRGADDPTSDGPTNLRDAVTVAAAPASRGLGALIVFDGGVFAARGTRKVHTLASAAFGAADSGPLGQVVEGRLHLHARPVRPAPLDAGRLDLDGVRVDIVAVYPGCDPVFLEAAVAAGARGVVLEATGAGNANPPVRDAVRRLTDDGVLVLLSTRVHAGPVVPLYGNGGGRDLVEAGALPTGLLRASQARVLLLALLGTGAGRAEVQAALGEAGTRSLAASEGTPPR